MDDNIFSVAKTLLSPEQELITTILTQDLKNLNDETINEAISKARISFSLEKNEKLDKIMNNEISKQELFLIMRIIAKVLPEMSNNELL
jgi:hypothetical protein